jgi:hypothetical protein
MGFTAPTAKRQRHVNWTDDDVLKLAALVAGVKDPQFELLAPEFGRTPDAMKTAWSRYGISSPTAKARNCNHCSRIFFSSHPGNRRCNRDLCRNASKRMACA